MRPVRFVVGGAAIALLLVGCGHDTGDLDSPDSPVARYDWDGGSAMDALLEGELAIVDGCLVVRVAYEPYGDSVALFPRKYAAWDAATETLSYAGRDYHVGDTISAGGGGGGIMPDDGVPDACREQLDTTDSLFWIQDESLEPYVPDGA